MTRPDTSHEAATIRSLRENPDLALAYMNDVIKDGDEEECLLALHRLAEAAGHALPGKEALTLRTLLEIRDALGIRMSFSRVAEL